MLALLIAAVFLGPLGSQPAGASEVSVPYEWYRYQGEFDSGPDATFNCEVTSATMAIQLVRGGLRVPIRDVRGVIGHGGATVTADAKKALRYWGVQTNDVDTIEQVVDAVKRGRVVIVGLMLGAVSPGEDLGNGRSATHVRTGRYSAYTGAHSIIVRGVSADGQWLTVYDPNHWDGNPAYLYADGTPKGKDRLYRTSEVASGMRTLVDFPRALEVIGTNAPLPNSTPVIKSGSPAITSTSAIPRKSAPRQSTDVVTLVSGGGSWSSAVVSFGVKNDGDGPAVFEAIGVRGARPGSKTFEVTQRAVTLNPGEERMISLMMDAPDSGEYQVKSVGYLSNGVWTELPASGRTSQATFRVGSSSSAPVRSTSPTPAAGKKPGGAALPGPQ